MAWEIEDIEPIAQPGYGAQIAGSLGGLAAKGAAGLAKVPTTAIDLLTSAIQQQPYVTSTGEIQHQKLSHPELLLTPKVEAAKKAALQQLPQGLNLPGEQFAGEVAEAAPFYLGSGMLPAIGKAAIGQSARKGVEALGGGQFAQTLAEIGTPTLATGVIKAARPSQLKKFAQGLYDSFSESIPSNLESSVKPMESSLAKWKKWTTTGSASDKGKQYVSEKISELESKIANGNIKTSELNEFKKDWRKALRDKEVPSGPAEAAMKSLESGANNTLTETGKIDKEFGSILPDLRKAESITYGMKDESSIRSGLRKLVNKKTLGSATAGALLGQKLLGYGPKTILGIGGAGLLARGIVEGGEALYKSPAIRKYAGDILKAEAAKDTPAMIRLSLKLEDAISKEQPKDEWIID